MSADQGTTERTGAAGPTLAVALGSALAIVPLRAVFGDVGWLVEAWLALAIVAGVVAILRIGRPARLWHDAVGFLVLGGFLVATHLSTNAIAGIIPTGATVDDLRQTLDRAQSLIESSRPGLNSTPSLRLITTATVVAVAIAIDMLAVVARLRAISGLAFLAIVTSAGAIGRTSVGFIGFVCAGGGYLLVLASGMALERREWTESAAVHGSARRSGVAGGGSGGRIAAGALAFALIVPTVIPLASDGLLSGMFSRGDGGGGSVSLSAFAKLRGTLNQAEATNLLSVQITQGMVPTDLSVNPFYLRQIVLDDYASNAGWSGTGDGDKIALRDRLDQAGDTSLLPTREFSARVEVLGLADSSVPIFGNLAQINGLGNAWRWNRDTATIGGSRISNNQSYSVQFEQPEPSREQLAAATVGSGPGFKRWLDLPSDVPEAVLAEAARITAGSASPYAKAVALSDYFTDDRNGFIYSTQTEDGDSGDALVDFLETKTGFCQQYAGAMAVMLRALKIPSRVVLGYTHQRPGDGNTFLVTSRDAHAWVEVYFAGYGWLPFDPTPLSGADAARDINVPYVPDPNAPTLTPGQSGTTIDGEPIDPSLEIPLVPDEVNFDSGTPFVPRAAEQPSPPYLLYAALTAGGLLLLLLLPAAARLAIRRRRIADARSTGGAWPWWLEYRATATDLGQDWPDSTTLREAPTLVAEQLPGASRHKGAPDTATELAALVERERFGPPPGTEATQAGRGSDLDLLGRAAVRELRSSYGPQARLAAAWWPRSIRRWARSALSRRVRAVLAAPRMVRTRLRRAT
ncbi:MAG: hypothetical protein JWN61_1712 [Pseudonocardiales bacterium]|nr:hypothetical protein [Pseudonocardiales bacterium]